MTQDQFLKRILPLQPTLQLTAEDAVQEIQRAC